MATMVLKFVILWRLLVYFTNPITEGNVVHLVLLIYQKNETNEIQQSKMSRNSPSHQCG